MSSHRRSLLLIGLVLSLGAGAAPSKPPAAKAKPKLIVVGWDGADWQLLDPLLQQGLLPNLKAMLGDGRQARLSTYRPRASPLIWTTLATGLTPLEHGVADFQEYDVATKQVMPISGRSRKGPALWNLASAKGLSVGVVGWWATWPAEVVNGFFVSDRAAPVLFDAEILAHSPGLTWPADLADGVRLLGRRLGQPSYEDVAKFLAVSRADFEEAVKSGKELENPITGFRKILGSTRVYARTALDLFDKKRPDILMVYFEGTDEAGHVLGRYHPPKLKGVSDEDFARYSRGVSLYYEECDRTLGELRRRAKESRAVLVLVSDHGFKWGADRPSAYSSVDTNTAYLWHDPYGVLVLEGPGIVPSTKRGEADVFDVVPVLCRLLGLPADPRMKGSVPKGFLVDSEVPKRVSPVRWDRVVKVQRVAIARDASAERKVAEEFTKKLISLGYLSGAPSAVGVAPQGGAGTEVRMTPYGVSNLGIFLAERGKDAEAIPYFERAIAADPGVAIFHQNLADALERLGRFAEADEEAVKAAAMPGTDGTTWLLARALQRTQDGKVEAARALMARAVKAFTPAPAQLRDGLGRLEFDLRRCREAEEIFDGLSKETPKDPNVWVMLARCRRCRGDTSGARAAYDTALSLAPDREPLRREAGSLAGP